MANDEIPVSYRTHSGNIRELQTYLREISNAYSDVRPVYPDGVYGKSTAGAVSDYQQIKGLPVTGEADRATWEAIADDYYDIMANLKEQTGIIPLPSADIILASGDSGTAVIIFQAMLNTLSGLYLNIPPNTLNGIFDDDTVRAVTEFQTIAGLPPTGKADIRTRNALTGLFNAIAESNS